MQSVSSWRNTCTRCLRRRAEIVAGPVEAGDRDELRLEALAEDARRPVAVDPGERAAAQRAVDMDVAVRDQLGARADRGDDDEVAAIGEDALARAHRLGDISVGAPARDVGAAATGRPRARMRRVAAALQRDQPGAEGRDALLGGAVLDADGGQLAGAQLAHELDEVGLRRGRPPARDRARAAR